MGHFVSSLREQEKRYRRDSRGDKRGRGGGGGGGERERGTGMKGKVQKKYKHSPLPLPASGTTGLAQCKPISVGRPSDATYKTPSPHPL